MKGGCRVGSAAPPALPRQPHSASRSYFGVRIATQELLVGDCLQILFFEVDGRLCRKPRMTSRFLPFLTLAVSLYLFFSPTTFSFPSFYFFAFSSHIFLCVFPSPHSCLVRFISFFYSCLLSLLLFLSFSFSSFHNFIPLLPHFSRFFHCLYPYF